MHSNVRLKLMIKWLIVYCAIGLLVAIGLAVWKALKGDEQWADHILFPLLDPIGLFLCLPFWPLFVIGALAIKCTEKYHLNNQDEIDSNDSEDELIGRVAMVANDLRPSGTVLIDGKSYSALSLGPVIESGVKVKVVKKEGFSLGVAEIEGKVGQAVPPKSDRAGG